MRLAVPGLSSDFPSSIFISGDNAPSFKWITCQAVPSRYLLNFHNSSGSVIPSTAPELEMDVPAGLRAGLARKYKEEVIAAKGEHEKFKEDTSQLTWASLPTTSSDRSALQDHTHSR